MIYGGSTGTASFSTRPYLVDSTNGAGISCDLKAVQVLNLVTSSQRSGESYGFAKLRATSTTMARQQRTAPVRARRESEPNRLRPTRRTSSRADGYKSGLEAKIAKQIEAR
jgi:hypothetical protein